uniref:Putative cnidarian restricted membrane protein n=1 Tax=Clytia hemisphaerica TaxID=252671 RepID=A0A069DMF3_9CNID
MEILFITGIVLYSIAIFCHFIAIYFLIHFKSNSLCSKNQRICLLNLCFCELLLSVIGITGKSIYIFECESVAQWVLLWQDGFLNVWYICTMTFITFDRFLVVHYNLRYDVYWSITKTKIGLIIIAIISLQVMLILHVIPSTIHQKFHIIFMYIWPIFDGIFLLVAIVTYIYLYRRIKQNHVYERNQLKSLRTNARRKSSVCFKKIKHGFYMPTFLILSFIFTWTIPDMILTGRFMYEHTIDEHLHAKIAIVYPVGLIFDAFLYILLPYSDVIHKMFKRSRSKT